MEKPSKSPGCDSLVKSVVIMATLLVERQPIGIVLDLRCVERRDQSLEMTWMSTVSVYIDQLTYHEPKGKQAKRYGTQWCHLFADTLEELHAFAGGLQQRRSYFQEHSNLPHYDLTPNKRQQAVRAGAIEVQTKAYLRKLRASRSVTKVAESHSI